MMLLLKYAQVESDDRMKNERPSQGIEPSIGKCTTKRFEREPFGKTKL